MSIITFDWSIAPRWHALSSALRQLENVLVVDLSTSEDDTTLCVRAIATGPDDLERALASIIRGRLDIYGAMIYVEREQPEALDWPDSETYVSDEED